MSHWAWSLVLLFQPRKESNQSGGHSEDEGEGLLKERPQASRTPPRALPVNTHSHSQTDRQTHVLRSWPPPAPHRSALASARPPLSHTFPPTFLALRGPYRWRPRAPYEELCFSEAPGMCVSGSAGTRGLAPSYMHLPGPFQVPAAISCWNSATKSKSGHMIPAPLWMEFPFAAICVKMACRARWVGNIITILLLICGGVSLIPTHLALHESHSQVSVNLIVTVKDQPPAVPVVLKGQQTCGYSAKAGLESATCTEV